MGQKEHLQHCLETIWCCLEAVGVYALRPSYSTSMTDVVPEKNPLIVWTKRRFYNSIVQNIKCPLTGEQINVWTVFIQRYKRVCIKLQLTRTNLTMLKKKQTGWKRLHST